MQFYNLTPLNFRHPFLFFSALVNGEARTNTNEVHAKEVYFAVEREQKQRILSLPSDLSSVGNVELLLTGSADLTGGVSHVFAISTEYSAGQVTEYMLIRCGTV